MSFWETPAGREARAARHVDRLVLNQALCADGCSCHGTAPAETPGFHDGLGGCGYRWSAHDNRDPRNQLPFGCPSEASARAQWGDR